MLAMFSLFALVGYRIASDGMRSIDEDETIDLQASLAIGGYPSPDREQRWVVGSMMKIAKVLESRYQVVTYAMIQIGLGYMIFVSDIGMMVLIILRWNAGERDALICKLLRGKLRELQQADRTNPNAAGSSSLT
jgi:hypothetical protein